MSALSDAGRGGGRRDQRAPVAGLPGDFPPPAPVDAQLAISAFIVCQDERGLLGDCLASLSALREIIVVDSGSTDGTLELIDAFVAAGYPIKLFKQPWLGFARQKQFALDQAAGPWCLSIDADERLDDALLSSLRKLDLDGGRTDGYWLARRDYLPGYGYAPSIVAAKALLRLVRKSHARFDATQLVHESISVKGETDVLRKGAILHFRNITLEHEARKASDYAVLKAKQRIAQGRRPSLIKLTLNPVLRFLSAYVLKRYCLCGRAGFIYAAMLGYYTFLTEANHYRLSLRDPQG